MSKKQNLSEDHFKELKDVLDNLSKAQYQVGVLETSKHELLHDVYMLKNKLSEIQVKLKEEYGDIVIDTNDGSYTKKED